MKRLLSIFLLFISAFGLVSCDGMLKTDGLKAGFGDVILKAENISIDTTLGITAGTLNIAKATSKINGKDIKIGTLAKNMESGPQTMEITVPDANDGTILYTGTGSVNVKVNEITEAKIVLTKKEVLQVNAYKVVFDPAKYTTGSLPALTEVHLVGGFTDATWKLDDTSTYKLNEQADGTWVGYFPIAPMNGKEFKISYNNNVSDWTAVLASTNPGMGMGMAGFYAQNNYGNNGVTVTGVLTCKIAFDPSKYTTESLPALTEVHLVGDFTDSPWAYTSTPFTYQLAKQSDGTWSGYFPIAPMNGKEFKICYNGGNWSTQLASTNPGMAMGNAGFFVTDAYSNNGVTVTFNF